jgi:hypothetical protein
MSQLVLEQTLVEVVPLGCEFSRMRKFIEHLLKERSRFVPLLEEAKDLVDFIGNDISILILLIVGMSFSFSLVQGVVVPIFITFNINNFSLLLF